MLDVAGLELRLGEAPLFAGISFRVTIGQRAALAGRNGQGKSTLMKAVLGQIGFDAGTITVDKGRTLGYLPQDIQPPATDTTPVEEVLEAVPGLAGLEDEVARLTERLAAAPEDAAILAAYGQAQARFESLGGYGADARARTILAGLGFSQERMDGRLGTLSGGWLMRVHLAKLLLQQPDLLLLDEPTNHLDIEAREWLLEWLRHYPGAIVLTSHDRFFLDALVERVLELEGGQLEVYHGNYSDYEVKRREHTERLKAAAARQEKELKRQQVFIERNRARAATASNVQSRLKQVARIEKITLPPEPPRIKLRFPEPASSGQLAFRLSGLGKAYGELRVFRGLDLELPAGERLAVAGVNGAGKTTLLKLLASRAEPSEGQVELGHGVQMQYFSQYEDDLDQPDWSLLQVMEESAPPECAVSRRTVLGCFLFSDDDVHKPVRVLSGGERARLKLARMLLRPSNLLVLDEPTNHLDLHSQGVLLSALKHFKGTTVFVSHDREFLSALATSVLEVKDGRAVHYPCDYEQYRWRVAQDARAAGAAEAATAPARGERAKAGQGKGAKGGGKGSKGAAQPAAAAAVARPPSAAELRERKRDITRQRRRIEEMERSLEEREARVAELEAAMALPGFFDDPARSVPAVTEHKALQVEVGAAYEELEAEMERLESMESEAA